MIGGSLKGNVKPVGDHDTHIPVDTAVNVPVAGGHGRDTAERIVTAVRYRQSHDVYFTETQVFRHVEGERGETSPVVPDEFSIHPEPGVLLNAVELQEYPSVPVFSADDQGFPVVTPSVPPVRIVLFRGISDEGVKAAGRLEGAPRVGYGDGPPRGVIEIGLYEFNLFLPFGGVVEFPIPEKGLPTPITQVFGHQSPSLIIQKSRMSRQAAAWTASRRLHLEGALSKCGQENTNKISR